MWCLNLLLCQLTNCILPTAKPATRESSSVARAGSFIPGKKKSKIRCAIWRRVYVNLVWIISGFSCQSSMLTHICHVTS